MSMFGWGMGDIIAISQLAIKVYTAYKEAPDDYQHISDEVKSLQILIDKAAPHFARTTLNNNSRQEGQQALKGCKDILEDLSSLIEKYNSSGTSQVLRKIRLGTEDIASLRTRLISNTALLNGFIQSCEIQGVQERIEERIAGVLGLHHRTSRVSLTSLPGSINTKIAYKRFCKNLFQIGVTPEMITQKEGEILNIFNQPQDTATGGETNDSGNIANQSQRLGPNLTQPRFRLPVDFLVGPLMLAAALSGNTKRVISALEYIQNIDFKDDQNDTALHKAVGGGHMDIVELLLQKGASTAAINNANNTPLDLAVQCGDLSMTGLLLEKGASIEAMDADDKNTLLHLAAGNGHTNTVEVLLEKGALMEAKAWGGKAWGHTPLHLAARSGHTSTVELLLEKGASIQATSWIDDTPLHIAAAHGHTSTVELLLRKGALTGTRNRDGHTPLVLAVRNGHVGTAKPLIEESAKRARMAMPVQRNHS